MKRPGLLLSIVLAAAACGRSGVYEDRSPTETVDGGEDPGDAGVRPTDAGCSEEATWTLEPRVSARIQSLLAPYATNMGATDRLVVEVPMQSRCEQLADVEVRLSPGGATDFVELAASVWVLTGRTCDPEPWTAKRLVTLPGRTHNNSRVVVRDANDPKVSLEFKRRSCSGVPECQCSQGMTPGTGTQGSTCVTDCQCAEGLSCVPWVRSDKLGNHECQPSCSDGLGCAPELTCSMRDGPFAYVCIEAPNTCDDAEACPEGLRCEPGEPSRTCVAERIATGLTCACDLDCGGGERCVEGNPPRCRLMCNVAGCPEGMLCAAGGFCAPR